MRFAITLAGLSVAAAITSPALASVNGYSIWFLADYAQDSNAQSTTLTQMTVGLQLSGAVGDVTSGYVSTPLLGNVDLFNDADYRLFNYAIFPTISDASVNYNAGTYKFYITGGAATSATPGSLSFSIHDYPFQIPYLTGTSYSRLQLCDPEQSHTITWNGFTNLNTTNDNSTSFIAQSYTSPADVIVVTQPQSGGSATLTPSYLTPGHFYGWTLSSTANKRAFNAGFGTAIADVTFTRRTGGYFEADIKPGWVAGIIDLENYTFGYGENIDISIVDSSDNVLASDTFVLGYYGHFSWNTGLSGTGYRVRVKGRHWISDSAPVNLTTGTRALTLNPLNGDIDNDNEVSILDYLALSESYGIVSTDANWNTTGASGFAPADCDLDRDLEVSILDYLILSNNYGLAGS